MKKMRTVVLPLFAAMLMVGALLGGISAAVEGPEEPVGPTKPTREQNVDAGGLIRVHEQGVADVEIQNENLDVTLSNEELNVNVTNDAVPVTGGVDVKNFPSNQNVSVQNFPANQSVSVSNFPSTQTVSLAGGMPAVTRALDLHFNPESGFGNQTQTFPVVNATTIIVAKGDDEASVNLLSSLLGPHGMSLVWDTAGSDSTLIFNFTYPIPVNGIDVTCMNESEDCNMTVSIAGF